MKHLARAAFLTLTLSVLATPCLAQGSRYGIVAAMNEQNEANAVQSLGAGAIRFTLYWNETEPNPGEFNPAVLDTHLDLTVPYGRPIFISVGERTPYWAGDCENCRPHDFNTYGNFVERVIRRTYARYPSADVVFGIWNEPNLDKFLIDTDDGQYYAGLFQAASAARDRVSTSIRLGAPETDHQAITNGNYFNSVMSRITPFMRPQDVVTVHWYFPPSFNLGSYMASVDARVGGREMWLTEVGQSTCNDTTQLNWYSGVINTFEQSTRNWARTFLYRLRSGENCDESIVRNDWSTRPFFTWYRDHIAGIAGSATMTAGQVLFANQSISSANGQFTLWYQGDGNLVLYRTGGAPVWHTNTNGTSPGMTVMQADGNLVIYDASSQAVWASNTWGSPGAYFAIQNNGRPVVYRANHSKAWECVAFTC